MSCQSARKRMRVIEVSKSTQSFSSSVASSARESFESSCGVHIMGNEWAPLWDPQVMGQVLLEFGNQLQSRIFGEKHSIVRRRNDDKEVAGDVVVVLCKRITSS